jgi:hypothetical protein
LSCSIFLLFFPRKNQRQKHGRQIFKEKNHRTIQNQTTQQQIKTYTNPRGGGTIKLPLQEIQRWQTLEATVATHDTSMHAPRNKQCM